MKMIQIAALALTLSLAGVATAQAPAVQAPTPPLPAGEQSAVKAIDRALAGVLYIDVTTPSSSESAAANPLFQDPQGGGDEASGSGFFVDSRGYALTNYHVVDGVSKITVNLRGSKQDFSARVVGTAPDYDLALIQVQGVPANLIRPLSLGDSDALKVGQATIALGSPFDLKFSATTGIVSALERSIPTGVRGISQNAIQTDAAINPGNSGGPLLNSAGQVIGINTQILSPAGAATGVGQSAGVGFAVPINVAKSLLPRLLAGQTVTGPIIGVALAPFELSALTDQARSQYKLPKAGALVVSVDPSGPAAGAGVKGGAKQVNSPFGPVALGGDVITAVDGQAVDTAGDLRGNLFGRRAGDRIVLTVSRSGQVLKLPVTLAAGSPPAPGGR